MHSRHYFFAVPLPDEAKQQLYKMSKCLKESLPFKKWVDRDDYHITLAFLGNADEEPLDKAVQQVRETTKDFHTFRLQLNHIGVFGRPGSPRILWADTAASGPLKDLRARVYAACERSGFELETRPFKPHITMARKWMGDQEFKLQTAEEKLGTFLPGPLFQVAEAVLYRTHPDRTPKYEKVESFPLMD